MSVVRTAVKTTPPYTDVETDDHPLALTRMDTAGYLCETFHPPEPNEK